MATPRREGLSIRLAEWPLNYVTLNTSRAAVRSPLGPLFPSPGGSCGTTDSIPARNQPSDEAGTIHHAREALWIG